jgi:predicted Ser/Thr protein kinase
MAEPKGPLQSAPLGYAALAAAIISVCFLVSSPMAAIIWGTGALFLLGTAALFRYHFEGLRRKKLPKPPNGAPSEYELRGYDLKRRLAAGQIAGAPSIRRSMAKPGQGPTPGGLSSHKAPPAAPTALSSSSQSGLGPPNGSSAQLIGARYRRASVLGEGGMKRVYLAEDTRLRNRQCAIAELLDVATDPTQQQVNQRAFEQEVDILLELDSGYIPKVYDRISEGNRHYLVMEFVPGTTLEKFVLNAGGRIEQLSALELASQILEALQYLHSRLPPVIFRDLKPDNVMVTPEKRIKLIDFGIARHFTKSRGTMVGTQGYAPPEQYRGQIDPRSDIYAFGGLLHRILSGRDPQAEPPFSFPPLASLCPTLDSRLSQLVDKCLNNDASKRPQSASEILNAVKTIVASGSPDSAPKPRAQTKPQVSFCTQCGTPLPPQGNCSNCGMARYQV